MRASQMHTNVQSLQQLGERGERVLAAVPPAVREQIEQAARVAWLPVELDIQLTEAVDRTLGRQALEDWSRESMRRSAQTPLLKPFLDGAVRLFGLKPHSILKLGPRAWTTVYRDCGTLGWAQPSPATGEFRLEECAEAIFESDAYLAGIAASFAAIFDITHVTGTVSVQREGPGSVLWGLDWTV